MSAYPTATPGLHVERWHVRDWRIVHALSIDSVGLLLPDASPAVNRFDTRKAALAAAERLGSIVGVDFTQERPFSDTTSHEERNRIRTAYIDALTGTTEEERRAVSRKASDVAEHERRGGLWRDVAQNRADELGHTLGWSQYGQRSWKGVCADCGAEVRVAYSSMQRRYQAGYGDAMVKECDENEKGGE